MVLPVPNLNAPVAEIRDPKTGKVIAEAKLTTPWNSFFQQFTQAPTEFLKVDYDSGTIGDYTAKEPGTIVLTGGFSIATVELIRGGVVLSLSATTSIIPVSIDDVVRIGATIPPQLTFIPR